MTINCKAVFATAVVSISLLFAAASSEAQDRQTLSARSGGASGVTFRKATPPYRLSDNGKPRRLWRQQVVYRAINDTFVYRSEGKATVRDEFSSPEVIFHTRGGPVRAGHVYQNRGN